MNILDPRFAAIAGVGGAVVGSERVRHLVGRGLGYTAKGVMMVGGPVLRPVLHAGEEIVDEARHTAIGNGHAKPAVPAESAPAKPRAKASS